MPALCRKKRGVLLMSLLNLQVTTCQVCWTFHSTSFLDEIAKSLSALLISSKPISYTLSLKFINAGAAHPAFVWKPGEEKDPLREACEDALEIIPRLEGPLAQHWVGHQAAVRILIPS
jgi:hypothetical protein